MELSFDGRKRDIDDAEVELKNELRSNDETKGQSQARGGCCTGIGRGRSFGGARSFGHDRPSR
jgi:hypothetical protein